MAKNWKKVAVKVSAFLQIQVVFGINAKVLIK